MTLQMDQHGKVTSYLSIQFILSQSLDKAMVSTSDALKRIYQLPQQNIKSSVQASNCTRCNGREEPPRGLWCGKTVLFKKSLAKATAGECLLIANISQQRIL